MNTPIAWMTYAGDLGDGPRVYSHEFRTRGVRLTAPGEIPRRAQIGARVLDVELEDGTRVHLAGYRIWRDSGGAWGLVGPPGARYGVDCGHTRFTHRGIEG